MLTFVVAGLVTGGFFAKRPWDEYKKQKIEAEKMSNELLQARAKEEKQAQASSRSTDSVRLEEAARRKGYAAPGEVVLTVRPPADVTPRRNTGTAAQGFAKP
jgi:hypothetical protein